MIGAMFEPMNSIMAWPSVASGVAGGDFLLLQELGELLLGGLALGLLSGVGYEALRKATRLISSESAWRPSSRKPSGSSANTGQRIRPPAFDEYSFIT